MQNKKTTNKESKRLMSMRGTSVGHEMSDRCRRTYKIKKLYMKRIGGRGQWTKGAKATWGAQGRRWRLDGQGADFFLLMFLICVCLSVFWLMSDRILVHIFNQTIRWELTVATVIQVEPEDWHLFMIVGQPCIRYGVTNTWSYICTDQLFVINQSRPGLSSYPSQHILNSWW